ncbi:hypothetical protein [Planctomicrobium sp. SH664]|uniref:hypothetical protein n=1 Tax=Planctomicrobium sp. SH664 TaxID=3448125 RepID=UPI003F5C805E
MKTQLHKHRSSTMARPVGPEDLRCGDFIAVLQEVVEVPTFPAGECFVESSAMTPQRYSYCPRRPAGPLRIEALCLPFVFVRNAKGQHRTLDIRLSQLARLDEDYSKTVWKLMRPREE